MIAAVRDGATAIGLVDGYFGGAAAVWHKEILYALSLGVRVLGASSMGALRAAECAAYGMEPVGEIARGLRQRAARRRCRGRARPCSAGVRQPADERAAGRCASDDRRARSAGRRSIAGEAEALRRSAEDCFFGDRTVEAIAEGAGLDRRPSGRGREALCAASRQPQAARRSAARREAEGGTRSARAVQRTWTFAVTPLWRQLFETANGPVTPV